MGAGFLIAPGRVCTCAHVAVAAAGVEDPAVSGEIRLDFPFLSEERSARIEAESWPARGLERDGEDIAFLQLDGEAVPGSRPARLLVQGGLADRLLTAYGFPAGNEVGAWVEVRLGQRRPDGTVQIESERSTGYRIQPGFSGAPLWDPQSRSVAGMIVSAEADRAAKTAFVIPGDRLAAVCRDARILDPGRPFALLTDGLAALPGSPLSGLEQFFGEYIGQPGRPTPFGGRREQLAELDDWLASPDEPYALLVEGAGRGKSALIARWVAQVAAEDRAQVAFVPVSIRFGTALKGISLSVLGARLRSLAGVHAELPQDPQVWLAEIEQHLREDREGQPPLLVVLDGADEAVNWSVGSDLRFPPQPGLGVKVLVSARSQAGRDAAAWARDLEWEGNARRVALPPLDPPGVGEVLRSMGDPLAGLATQVDVVGELHRLSEGDPLLVRLYVEALRGRGEHAAFLAPEDLRRLAPGLKSYFDRWWADQREQWGGETPLKEPAVRGLLNLLACALGPLTADDLLALLEQEGVDTWVLEEALRPLARFVISLADGRQSGYVFSHSRLNQYFYERLAPRDRESWERRFLAYGGEVLTALRDGRLEPAHVPAYLIKYYAEHLERCEVEPRRFYELVDEGWMKAWEALEGTYDGFLANVDAAWKRAERAGRDAAGSGRGEAIGWQCRCALVVASIHSLAMGMPGSFLKALVEKGVWTPAQALTQALRNPDEWPRANALALLSTCLPDFLVRRAIEAVRQISDAKHQSPALQALGVRLAELGHVQEALELLPEIREPVPRARALAAMAPILENETLDRTLAEEVAAAGGHLPWDQVKVLDTLAPLAAEEDRPGLLEQALDALWAMQEQIKWDLLVALAARLPSRLLAESVSRARALDDPAERAKALAVLASAVSEEERGSVAAEALAALEAVEGFSRAYWLRHLGPALEEPLLEQAVRQAESLTEGRDYALAGFLPLIVRAGRTQEALARAREMKTSHSRTEALCELLPHLPEADRKEVLGEALATARTSGDSRHMINLAAQQPTGGDQLAMYREVLERARASDQDRIFILSDLAALLPEALLREALAIARLLGDEIRRSRALFVLGSCLPPADPILDEVVRSIRNNLLGLRTRSRHEYEGWLREWIVSRLSAAAPSPLSLQVARALPLPRLQTESLIGLMRRSPADEARELHVEIRETARKIQEPGERVETLASLAENLPDLAREEVLREALATAGAIPEAGERAEALLRLAPLLQDGERSTAIQEALAALHSCEWFPQSTKEPLERLIPLLAEPVLRDFCRYTEDQFRRRAEGDKNLFYLDWSLLVAFARHLVDLGHPTEAIDLLRRLPESKTTSRMMADLAAFLAERDEREEAAALAFEVPDPYWRTEALLSVLAAWPEDHSRLGSAALASARQVEWRWSLSMLSVAKWASRSEFDNPGDRALALGRVAAFLPAAESLPLLMEAIESAADHIFDRDDTWAGLVLHMARLGFLHQALELAGELPEGWPRAQALAEIAALVPEAERPDLLRRSLETARSIGSETWRAKALEAEVWNEGALLSPEELYPLWCERLRLLATCDHGQLLDELQGSSFLTTVGGETAVRLTLQAIVDVGRWFP